MAWSRRVPWPRSFDRTLIILLLVFGTEISVIAFAYQFLVSFECQATGAENACRLLRSFVARGVCLLAAFILFVWARPQSLAWLGRRGGSRGRPGAAAFLHFGGIALILLPLAMAENGELSQSFSQAVVPWIAGGVAASLGALLWVAAPRDWWAWLRHEQFVPLGVALAAVLIPDLADVALPLWDLSALTRLTFVAVKLVLSMSGAGIFSDPAGHIIGMDGFLVHVARQCSGVEGLALIVSFTALYAFLFRRETRLLRFALVVLPLGLALSWALNVLRIAALIVIGAHVSPDLAVNGFHSYAGWMFFTLLALALLWAVQVTPWFHSGGGQGRLVASPPPLRADPNAALIVPFIAFMVASVVTAALAPHPDLGYPLKVAAMAGALIAFHRIYREQLEWSLDPVAIATGLAVGIGWIALEPLPGENDLLLAASLAGLGTLAMAAWLATRLIGTILLVPVVEELFFRGYLLRRLAGGGPLSHVIAIGVSSGLFALLHTRWLEAFCAGIVFALLALRRGRLADAIVAHVGANLVVALRAAACGNWGAF